MTTSAALPPLRADPDFRRFWAARMVTLAGTSVTIVALPVVVYAMTHSPLVTAFVAAAEALPYLLFGLIAGALADRWERRRVMVVTDLLSALVIGSLPVAYALDLLTVGHVLAVAFVVPTLFVFFDAADFGAIPMLVGRARIASAQSAIWSAGTVVEIAVPGLAGAALAVVAAPELLVADALSYVASAVLISRVRRPLSWEHRSRAPVRPAALVADVREGLVWLWRHAPVRVMTAIGAAQSVAGGAFMGQLVVWADRVLGVRAGDVRLGILFSAWGVGSLASTLVLPRLAARYGAVRLALYGIPCSALLALAVALSTQWVVATVLTAGWGAAYMLVVVNAITYRQQVTPDALMSRVNTTGRMLSFGLGAPFGALLGGVVANSAGPRAALVAGAGVLAVGAAGAWFSPLRAVAGLPAGELA